MTNPKKIILTLAGAAAAFTALISFAPEATAQNYGGDYCREYTRTVTIGNRREEAYGTACLQPDGQWRIVNEGNMRPVSYDNYVNANRTVVLQQPTQIVYRDRTPTRVFFFGTPRRYDNHHHYHRNDRKYVRHDYRGHGPKHHHKRGHRHGNGHRNHR